MSHICLRVREASGKESRNKEKILYRTTEEWNNLTRAFIYLPTSTTVDMSHAKGDRSGAIPVFNVLLFTLYCKMAKL